MKYLRTFIIVVILMLLIPRVVYAGEGGEVYFYDYDTLNEYTEHKMEITFGGGMDVAQKAELLMNILIMGVEDAETMVPKGTQVIWTNYFEDTLIINLNENALNCGGNYQTELFVNQLVKTAYSLEEIRGIMLYVEGGENNLPEGIDFSAYNR